MKELLTQITMTVKALFTEWLPTYINADLGPIGDFATAIGVLLIILGFIKFLFKRYH